MTDQEVLKILTREVPADRSIRKALGWLRQQQQPAGQIGGKKHATAMTAFGIMAFLSAGITFDHPQHGTFLRKAIRYVLEQQDPNGYYGAKDSSRMYGHGITTLMLAEAIGMVRDEELEERIRKSLTRAVAVTVNAAQIKKSAKHQGGWRYGARDSSSDLSLSGWQILSLHAAQQVGITVPEAVIKNAVAYAKRNSSADGKVGYQSPTNSPVLRGLGLLCLSIGGEEDAPLGRAIGERIKNDPITWKGNWFFYRAYYDAVGVARARPEIWRDYGTKLVELLVKYQNPDGTWPVPPNDNEKKYGMVYRTALAVLALTVDRHILPAYQR